MLSTNSDLDKLEAKLKAQLIFLKVQFARKQNAILPQTSSGRPAEKRLYRKQQLRAAKSESNKIAILIKKIEESLCSKKTSN